jgi:hypothetical protein
MEPSILCLLYLTFASESFSSAATFYVPVLAFNHFHLELIYVKLLFPNCTLFTLLLFILFSLASDYFDELGTNIDWIHLESHHKFSKLHVIAVYMSWYALLRFSAQ